MRLGKEGPRGAGGGRVLVTYAPVQSDDRVRALHGSPEDPQDGPRSEACRHGAYEQGLGEDQCGFQAMKRCIYADE